MVRRCLTSKIPFDNGNMIGTSILPTQTRRLNEFNSSILNSGSTKKVEGSYEEPVVRREDSRYVWNMAKYRDLTLITSCLWFKYVSKDVKASQTAKLIEGPRLYGWRGR